MTQNSSSSISLEQRKLLNVVCIGFFVSGACSQAIGPLIPFFSETFGFGYDVSGILISLHSIGNLTTVLLAGVLPSYLGRRKSILLTSMWMSVAFLIFTVTQSSTLLIMFACFLTGFARGGNSTFANTMVSTLGGQAATKGYNKSHGSYALGALISPLVIFFGLSLISDFNWRYICIILCVVALCQFVLYLKMKLPTETKRGGFKTIDKTFLKNKHFWLGTAMLFFYISTEYAIAGWLVTYFQDTEILSPDNSQLTSSLFWFTIFLGRLVGANIVGKISRKKLLVIDGVGLLASFVFMFFSNTALTATIGLVGVGLFLATIYPTAFSFGSECISGNDFGCSLMSFIASTGGIITPAVVGFVASVAGINAGMGLVVAVVVILLIVIITSVYSTRIVNKPKQI